MFFLFYFLQCDLFIFLLAFLDTFNATWHWTCLLIVANCWSTALNGVCHQSCASTFVTWTPPRIVLLNLYNQSTGQQCNSFYINRLEMLILLYFLVLRLSPLLVAVKAKPWLPPAPPPNHHRHLQQQQQQHSQLHSQWAEHHTEVEILSFSLVIFSPCRFFSFTVLIWSHRAKCIKIPSVKYFFPSTLLAACFMPLFTH